MKLSKKIKSHITDKLIIRINELYHDLEHELYSIRHGEMFKKEKIHWKELSERYFNSSKAITWLDYGSGTGFVPLTIGGKVKKEDTLICSDLSNEILEICRKNLAKQNFNYAKKFIKIDGKNIPLQNNSLDIITVNSVLHHILDLNQYSREVFRCLKPNGKLIVVHEPNGEIKLNLFYRLQIRLISFIKNPQQFIFGLSEKFAFIEFLLRRILNKISKYYRKRNKMLDEIAYKLMSEGLIDFKLRGTAIQQLVDIHTDKGFFKKNLLEIFKDFNLLEWQTYNFIEGTGKTVDKLNSKLQKKYPENGKTLLFVLEKKN